MVVLYWFTNEYKHLIGWSGGKLPPCATYSASIWKLSWDPEIGDQSDLDFLDRILLHELHTFSHQGMLHVLSAYPFPF